MRQGGGGSQGAGTLQMAAQAACRALGGGGALRRWEAREAKAGEERYSWKEGWQTGRAATTFA